MREVTGHKLQASTAESVGFFNVLYILLLALQKTQSFTLLLIINIEKQ